MPYVTELQQQLKLSYSFLLLSHGHALLWIQLRDVFIKGQIKATHES